MSGKGWISIHRKLQEHWLWQDKPFSKGQAWIDIILMVNHDDGKVIFRDSLYDVKRGQRITSELKLSDRWGWSRNKVRKFLNDLKSDGMITIEKDKRKTLITVENYNDYQDSKNTKGTTERTSEGTTEGQQKDINNNVNNDNKINNKYIVLFDYWNNKKIIVHKKLTEKMKTKIRSALKDYSPEELEKIIDTYTEILKDEKYYFSYKWTLEDFLSRGLGKFSDPEAAKQNFIKDKQQEKSTIEKIKTTKFHNFKERTEDYTAKELEKKVLALSAKKRADNK